LNKIIYFTLGNNLNYIKLANLCIKSLYKQNYDGDFLFITDLKNELLNTIKFNKDPIFIEVTKSNLMMSSSNKLKLYLYDRIFEYDSIIFSDLDILWTSNPKKIFDLLNEDKFFFSNENALMSGEWWGARILSDEEKSSINNKKIFGLNAGIFAFNKNMVDHLKKIDDFLNQNLHLSNECLEQPFINTYLYRNDLYNTGLNELVSHNGYNTEIFNGVALHFAGGPGNFPVKFERMLNYYNKNIDSI
jgi:hypothetical protein